MSVVYGLLAATCLSVPAGLLVDRVAAVVDKQVITQSELLVEAHVALVLREGAVAATVDLDEVALRAFADYLVNQLLIATQARRLGTAEVAEADVDREVHGVVQRFASTTAYQAWLQRFGITPATLRHVLERNLQNQRFISDRMRLLVAGGAALDPSSPEYQQALRRWLDELRDAVDVRLCGPSGELELVPKRAPVANGGAATGP